MNDIKELNVFYISDLHIDFHIKETNESEKLKKQINKFILDLGVQNIPEQERDVIVIAGDLSHYFVHNKIFLSQLKELFREVIVVPGNHDYYLVSNAQEKKYLFNSYNRILELKVFCAENKINFLDGKSICIDGFRIGGAMGYWDSSYLKHLNPKVTEYEANELYKKELNDINFIMFGEKPYKIPLAYGAYHLKSTFESSEFREVQMKRIQDITDEGSLHLMITHYAPTIHLEFPEKYQDDEVNTFYTFDGSKFQETLKPKFWLFGHVHHRQNFLINETNYLSNPYGYPSEQKYLKTMLQKVTLSVGE